MIAVDYSSSTSFNEDAFEQGIIDHLLTSLGYEHLYGPDVARSSDAFDDAFLPDVIGPALESINPTLNRRAIEASITKLKEIEGQRPHRREQHLYGHAPERCGDKLV